MSTIDIYTLPVSNAAIKTLTLYDAIVRQYSEKITLTITDNASVDLDPKAIVQDDRIFYMSTKSKIKNTGSIVTQAILSHPSPSKYVLLLNVNSIIHENYIQQLLDFVQTTPDSAITLGTAGYLLKRSTKRYPDPRETSYKSFLKTLRQQASTNSSDSTAFTKISGKTNTVPENESELVFENEKYDEELHKINVKELEKLRSIIPDTRNDMEAIVQEEKLDPMSVSESDNSILRDPAKLDFKTRFQKYFDTERWESNFAFTNILIRREKLMEYGIFDRNSPIVESILRFIIFATEFAGETIDFNPSFPIYEHFSKKFDRPSVKSKADKIRSSLPQIGQETKSGGERVRENYIGRTFLCTPQASAPFIFSHTAPYPYKTPIIFYRNYKEGNLVVFNSNGKIPTRLSIVYRNLSNVLDGYKSVCIPLDREVNMGRLCESFGSEYDFCLYLSRDEEFVKEAEIDSWLRCAVENSDKVIVRDAGHYRVLSDKIEIGEDWSFCCHKDMLECSGSLREWGKRMCTVTETIRDIVMEYMGTVRLVAGTASGTLFEAEPEHRINWYDWMED